MKDRWKTPGSELAKEHPVWYDLFEKLEELATIVFDNLQGQSIKQGSTWLYEVALIVNYLKARNSYSSVAVLCDKGCVGDAKTICRKLIELLINMTYLSEDPLKRQHQYWGHLPQGVKKLIGSVLRNEECFSKDAVLEARNKNARALKALEQAKEHWDKDEDGKIKGDFKRNWSGKTLIDMAESCGMKLEYIHPYVKYSTPTHASSWDIPNYFQFDVPAFIQHPEQKDIPLVIADAIRNYHGLTDLVIRAFKLDLEESSEQFLVFLEHIVEEEFGNEQR